MALRLWGEARVESMSHWLLPILLWGRGPKGIFGVTLFWSPVTSMRPAVEPTLGIKCDPDL